MSQSNSLDHGPREEKEVETRDMSSAVPKLPVLPPGLQGVSRGRARIEVRRVRLVKSEPLRVEICWWGQKECDTVPVSKGGVGRRAITYDVVTDRERFVRYLNDAKKLESSLGYDSSFGDGKGGK